MGDPISEDYEEGDVCSHCWDEYPTPAYIRVVFHGIQPQEGVTVTIPNDHFFILKQRDGFPCFFIVYAQIGDAYHRVIANYDNETHNLVLQLYSTEYPQAASLFQKEITDGSCSNYFENSYVFDQSGVQGWNGTGHISWGPKINEAAYLAQERYA